MEQTHADSAQNPAQAEVQWHPQPEAVPIGPDTRKAVVKVDDESRAKKVIRRKRRPARVQIDPAETGAPPSAQTGIIFNIWYNKWSGGDREDKFLSQTHAKGRCNVATDAGYTRADKVTGSYFCIFFARGICPKGQDCEYLHRLPGLHDHFDPNIDCFGRDKHSEYRDDMGGVGSFMRQNRTLYVGRIYVTGDIEEVVARHFQEWGEIERTRVLTARGVAFVTFANEANAQFAKEAMAHQSLDHEEILNVRWATVDPNPTSQKREARRIEEQAAEAVRRALPPEYVAELESTGSHASKRKRIEPAFSLEGYDAPDAVWYGSTRRLKPGQECDKLETHDSVKLDKVSLGGSPEPAVIKESTESLIRNETATAFQRLTASTNRKGHSSTVALVGYHSDDESD